MALPNPKTYTMNAAGEQSYKNSVDRYNQANPNSKITYAPRATYNTAPAVTQKGSMYTVGDREFGSQQDAKSWASTQGMYAQPTQNVSTPNAPQPTQVQQAQQSTMTPEQLAEQDRIAQEGMVNKGFADTNKVSDQYGLEKGPSTISEMVSKFKEDQAQELKYAQEQNARQAALDAAQEAKFQEQATGAKAATNAVMAQGREAPISGSAPKFASEFTVQMNKQIDENRIRLQSAQAARDQAILQLAKAQKEGQTKLAAQIQGSLAAAEVEIQKAKTNYMATLADFNKQSLDTIKQLGENGMLAGADAATLQSYSDQYGIPMAQLKAAANASAMKGASTAAQQQFENQTKALDTFKGLVTQGVGISLDLARSYASQTGLPVEDLLMFNQTAAAIMDDKTLSNEQKAQLIQEKGYTLDQMSRGIFTEAGRKQDELMRLYANGASQAEIDNFKQFAGIDTDAVYNAKLNSQILENRISQAKLNGQPIGAQEWADYGNTYQTLVQAGQENSAIIPQGGKFSVVNNGEQGIQIDVQEGQKLNDPATARDEGQCGAFVNDVFGKRIVGNGYDKGPNNKMSFVDPTITMPTPGMAFVMKTNAPEGHIGMVENVNYAEGTMDIVDANWNLDGKVDRRTIPISSASGFIRPPNGQPLTVATKNQVAGMTDADILSAYESAGKTFTSGSDARKAINLAKQTGFVPSAGGAKTTKLPADKVVMLEDAKFLPTTLDKLETTINGGKGTFDPIWGQIDKINPLAWYDENKQTVNAELRTAAQLIGKYMEGGVLRAEDEIKYQQMLPNNKDTREVALDKLKQVREMLKDKTKGYIQGLDASGYDVKNYMNDLTKLSTGPAKESYGNLLQQTDLQTHPNFDRY